MDRECGRWMIGCVMLFWFWIGLREFLEGLYLIGRLELYVGVGGRVDLNIYII